MTRLSCRRFRSDEVRLWLSVIACNLGNLRRRLYHPKSGEGWSLTSLQQRLVKTCGRGVKHDQYYWLLLAESVAAATRGNSLEARYAKRSNYPTLDFASAVGVPLGLRPGPSSAPRSFPRRRRLFPEWQQRPNSCELSSGGLPCRSAMFMPLRRFEQHVFQDGACFCRRTLSVYAA